MKTRNPAAAMVRSIRLATCATIVLSLSQCVAPNGTTSAAQTEKQAVRHLDAARQAAQLLKADPGDVDALEAYNKAASELTILLRSSQGGGMWNRTSTFTNGSSTYQLSFTNESGNETWDASYFSSFASADKVPLKTIDHRNLRLGLGGSLVGIHKTEPLKTFSPRVGITAPVTAVLNFQDQNATLSLIDPTKRDNAQVADTRWILNADFSAPLAYYPQESELWEGLMGGLRAADYMKTTGLYMLQPYDPDRIPLIFVHGLISTPRMWRNVINELERDPEFRKNYQCWVFGYPTGNPPLYSALRFREELEKLHQLYPDSKNYVLVGHSMGGLVSRAQVTDVDREAWDAIGEDKADQFFANIEPGGLVDRATRFQANPRVDRVIFICTPHRGSEMALGSIGDLARRLIALPADLTGTLQKSIGDGVAVITGDPDRMPNSVFGLAPKNPALVMLDTRPIKAVHHSIIGDRGKGDSPDSSDGVVRYWSSHLKSTDSEKVVPAPHAAVEHPETIAELQRILHLHLK